VGSKALFRAGRVAALWLGLPLAMAATSGGAHAACHLAQVAALQVINDSGTPLVKAKINGQDVVFAVDTGNARTSLEMAAAQKLGLRLISAPGGMRMYGAGGEINVHQTTVDLEFGGAQAHHLDLLVVGQPGRDFGFAALIGWDLLQHWDVEFDLAHHVIRLLTPDGCKGDDVAYWASAYSKAPLGWNEMYDPEIKLDVLLNGRREQAELDSGAERSTVTPEAAAQAGVTPETKPEDQSYGLGPAAISVSTATFKTFSIGGEEIKNARIEVADMFSKDTYTETGSLLRHQVEDLPQMLLGADFLRAHRVMIATDQRVAYFTYAGDPVFDLGQARAAPSPATGTQVQAGPAAKAQDK